MQAPATAQRENRSTNESEALPNVAPHPARGRYADGFGGVAQQFADQLASGEELGAALSVYQRGRPILDLWGGVADVATGKPWERDTRIVVFSVTKGLMAMAMNMLADRGLVAWDAPVADYWPGFAGGGKGGISVRNLLNHRGGLPYLSTKLSLSEAADATRAGELRRALEAQRPEWAAGERQGYHAITFGMFARELFEQITGESPGTFLRRELFEPLGADVHLGTPASEDHKLATLYGPGLAARLARMVAVTLLTPEAPEAIIARDVVKKMSVARRAFENPAVGREGVLAYNRREVLRAELAWASATASAGGVARAYLPFANDGTHGGRSYVAPATLEPVYKRQSWSARDAVLMKPLGWSQGFLKEERHLFCPNPESFGHAGMGGALGWADPVAQVSFGYVMNRMDWRVRSPRVLALCRALYESEALRG